MTMDVVVLNMSVIKERQASGYERDGYTMSGGRFTSAVVVANNSRLTVKSHSVIRCSR